MTTITKEWLQQTIAEFENTRDDIPFGLSDDDAKVLIVLKRALASLDAEPAGYHVIKECGKVGCSVATLEEAEKTRDFWNKKWTIRPYFYSAAPAPVVPDDWVMVPKEPTRQMMAQGHFAMKGTDRGKFRRIYQAMITAASALNKGEY